MQNVLVQRDARYPLILKSWKGKFFSTGGDGDPANYRFYAAIDSNGISSIFIANSSGGIEVDDLQYGFLGVTREPATLSLLGLGALLVGALQRR